VWIDDEAMRVEQGDDLLVSSPRVYDLRPRRITAVAVQGRQQYRHVPSGTGHGNDVQPRLPVWGMPCQCACVDDLQDYTSKSVDMIRGHSKV